MKLVKYNWRFRYCTAYFSPQMFSGTYFNPLFSCKMRLLELQPPCWTGRVIMKHRPTCSASIQWTRWVSDDREAVLLMLTRFILQKVQNTWSWMIKPGRCEKTSTYGITAFSDAHIPDCSVLWCVIAGFCMLPPLKWYFQSKCYHIFYTDLRYVKLSSEKKNYGLLLC